MLPVQNAIPRRTLQILIVAAFAFAVFLPALGGDPVSDDVSLIHASSGAFVDAVSRRFWADDASAHGVYQGVYRPFTQLLLYLVCKLSGARPVAFHLLNVLLHVASSLLVLRWLERRLSIVQDAASPDSAPLSSWGALVGAILFAVHPVHAESVAWISGITDLAMTLCLLVALELLERDTLLGRASALLAFAAAVLAKESALVVPVLVACDAWARALPRREQGVRVALSLLGCGLAAALVLWVGLSGSEALSDVGPPQLKNVLATLGFYVRAAIAPSVLTFQAQPFVPGENGLVLPLWSMALGTLLLALIVAAALRASLGSRSQTARAWLSDALWFLLPLAPSVLLVSDSISDRFLYLPLLGFVALIGRALDGVLRGGRTWQRRAAGALVPLALGLAVVQGSRAAACFVSNDALWRSQLAAYPHLLKPYDALAEDLALRGKHDQARTYFERGLVRAQALASRHMTLHFLVHLASVDAAARPEWDAHSQQLSSRYCHDLFERALAWYERGTIKVHIQGKTQEIAQAAVKPVHLAVVPCARAFLNAQEFPSALEYATEALRIAPDDRQAREVAALALARTGRFLEARDIISTRTVTGEQPAGLEVLERRVHDAEAVTRAPPPATDERSRALRSAHAALILGSPVSARRALDAASPDPTDHEVVHWRAQSYVSEGRIAEAQKAVEQAARLAPADPFFQAELKQLAQLTGSTAAPR
jgi:tetratricopeptide (TPR) repeat protein